MAWIVNSREICVSMRKNRDVNKLDGAWDDKMAAIEFRPQFRKYFCYIFSFHIPFLEKQNIERKNWKRIHVIKKFRFAKNKIFDSQVPKIGSQIATC